MFNLYRFLVDCVDELCDLGRLGLFKLGLHFLFRIFFMSLFLLKEGDSGGWCGYISRCCVVDSMKKYEKMYEV
jgi:hypothetical protein